MFSLRSPRALQCSTEPRISELHQWQSPKAIAVTRLQGRAQLFLIQFSNSQDNTRPHSRGAMRPSFCNIYSPRKQRAQGKPGARCTRSLACEIKIAHERSHHRFRRIQPGLPRAMVLTAYFALSPATRLCCHRRLRIWYVKTRLGLRTSARLDASIGASEPHDFTVREKRLSSACHSSAHGPCRPALPSPDIA